MKRIWLVIGSIFLGSSTGFSASSKGQPKPDAADATRQEDKAAASHASSAADSWAAKQKAMPADPEPTFSDATGTPPASEPAKKDEKKPEMKVEKKAEKKEENKDEKASEKAAVAPTPVPADGAAATPPPAIKPLSQRPGTNEMRGKLLSKSYDPRVLRLIVEGGFNVEFTYDVKTTLMQGDKVLSIDDLGYNDDLKVRYIGKELYAVEIERVSKAPRPE